MVRLIAPVLLFTAGGLLMPLAVIQAQSAPTTVQREAQRTSARSNGSWTQAQGEAKESWAKLTDDDIEELDGRREILIGKLQTRYAIGHEEAEHQVGDFEARRP